VTWEMAVIRRTRLSNYQNCLRLFDAYTDFAPLWERVLLSAYIGLGPPLARVFGGNTKTVWRQAEALMEDLFAVTQMTPKQVVDSLRRFMKTKHEADHDLTFSEARERIYDQEFYPLVTHFTFAFQSSAIARMRFVKRVAEAMAFSKATVADLGCGSGAMLCEILQSQTGWTGYGLDISEASIGYARRLASYKGVAGRAAFQQGSITQLPFASSSIDLVVASEVIEHLPQPAAAFNEIVRVLAPGGFLALTVPIDSHTPAHINSPSSADEFDRLCREAGLTVHSLSSKWHLTFGDDRRHLFAVAQLRAQGEAATQSVYSLPRPQMSSAASNGIVSS
jgi:ubiquinone/menaquinone biosynthesis C-methylase UbiE